ncbi:MAG: DUF1302 family protein [Pseudomonadota bacterium]
MNRKNLSLQIALACTIAFAANTVNAVESDSEKNNVKFSGIWQFEGARTFTSPEHASKLKNAFDLALQGGLSEDIKWKLSGRLSYDAVYDVNNFYPGPVAHDQRAEALALENYLDISKGDWDFRLGRQHIIWGEVVGLFFADVVSAKDLRESVLQDFDRIRIPQWATRVEYFKNDFHAEAVWIPYMTYNEIGKPGSEFYSYPPPGPAGYGYQIRDEVTPSRNLSNTAYGLRLSYLVNGWDMSGFVYQSVDASAAFSREIQAGPTPAFIYTPEHHKIHQGGMSVAKDLGNMVVKAEAVYTGDREFTVTRLSDTDGLVKQNTLDYILGMEWPLPEDARLNIQLFGRTVFNHDPDILVKKQENGLTMLWSGKYGNWEPQLLLISSLNHTDWLARPRVLWNFAHNWRAAAGVDLLGGKATGFFGQFDNKDRAYMEVRYTF